VGPPAAVAGGGVVILLTLRDVQHRLVRFLVVIVLGAVVFALLFVMTGLVEHFNREPHDTVRAFRASTWVLPEGVSGPFTAASTMSLADAGQVDAAVRSPAVIARSSLTIDGSSEAIVLVGHEAGGLGTPPTGDGRAATAPGEVVLDRSTGADIGDTVAVAGREVTVVGLSDDTTLLAGIPLAFVTLTDAQDLVFQDRDVVSVVLVEGEPASVPAGFVARSGAAVADDALEPLEGAISSVDLVRVLLWIVAAVIIGAVVYLSALERLRDFAVLKAIGASNRGLMGGLALQAVLVALASVALAALLQLVLAPRFPLEVTVPGRAFVQIPVLAVVVALLAGAVGMRRVAASDPALAFAGAGG